MKKIKVIHGPNLNLLGMREPQVYGINTLDQLNNQLAEQAQISNFTINFYQSNNEAEMINAIQQSFNEHVDYIIINPAAFTHTSIALRDALLAVNIPFIEVHISNIFNRESFRHKSYLADLALGVISGFGIYSYNLALQAIIQREKTNGHPQN